MTASAEEAPEISRIPARFRNTVSSLSHLLRHLNLSNNTSVLHEAIGACANEYLLKSVGCHRIFLNACGGLLLRRSPRRRVLFWYLVYVLVVCIGSGRQSECDSRLRPKFERTRQKPKLSNMKKKIVWRWSTFCQTARSYSQYIFLTFSCSLCCCQVSKPFI